MKNAPIFFAVLLPAVILSTTSKGRAQSFPDNRRIQTISVEDGLSQSSVWCIMQDSKGFMWFGTADGLNRYDGYTFRVYRHSSNDPFSLRSNTVFSLLEDRKGRIWVGTAAGLHVYNRESGRFSYIPDDSAFQSPNLRSIIYSTVEDRDGNVWVGSLGGFSILNVDKRECKTYYPEDFGWNGEDQDVRVPLMDRAGNVWVTFRHHTLCFDRTSQRFKEMQMPDTDRLNWMAFNQDRTGRFWFGPFGKGLCTTDSNLTSLQSWSHNEANLQSISSNFVRTVCDDDEGRLWVGTISGGLNLFDVAQNTFTPIVPQSLDARNTLYDKVASMYRDRSGIIWVGYDGSGLLKINPRRNKFRHVLLPPSSMARSGDNFFKALIVDRSQRVWLGTYNQGVAVYDRTTRTVQRLAHEPSNPATLVANTVLALQEDRRGVIWIGTTSGLDAYQPAQRRLRHYVLHDIRPDDLRGRIITSLHTGEDGTLWVGTATSILKYDAARDDVITVLDCGHVDSLQRHSNILCFATEGQTLWCGTLRNGLLKVSMDGRVLKRYMPNPADSNSISHSAVKTICRDPDGVFWIGTEAGLNRFDPVTETWRVYRASHGLPNEFIYGVLIDKNRNLWISTNRGISRMNTREYAQPLFRNYTVKDGLQASEFNTNAYFQTPEGELFFGGVNGFNAFFPDSIYDNPNVPQIVITGFKKFDQPFELGGDIGSLSRIELRYDESVFSLEFAALEYTDQRENRYAYKMEGVDKDWVFCGTRREARYTNLDPGEYSFRVKGTNNDGVWNASGTSIRVVIVPPFWKTRWFLGVVLILAIGTLSGTVRYVSTRKLRRTIEQLEREKAVHAERLKTRERIARDLHDDLASTVGSAGFFIASVKNQLKNVPAQTIEFLDKTSSLLTEAEEAMSDIVWSVSPKHDTLESLLSRIRLTTADVCRAHQINYEVAIDQAIRESTLSEEIRRSIYLIFKEALTNAVRHSGASCIRIGFEVVEGRFELTIADNGKGLVAPSPSTSTKRGHGLRNMAKRAEEAQLTFSLEKNMPSGTIAKVRGTMTQVSH